LATAVLENPTGYGRIARDSYGNMQGIVEHNDCTAEQLTIKEVIQAIIVFKNKALFGALANIKPITPRTNTI